MEPVFEWNSGGSWEELARLLPLPLLLLDEEGRICWNNAAWRDLAARDGFPFSRQAPGWNYLEECRTHPEAGGRELGGYLRDFLDARNETRNLCHDACLKVKSAHSGRILPIRLFRIARPRGVLMALPESHRIGRSESAADTDAPFPWFSIDREGNILAASERLCQLLHTHVEGLLGQKAWELIHPDDRAAYWQEILNGCGSGQSPEVRQVRLLPSNDRILIFEAHAGAVTDPSGEFGGLRICLFDVTSRELARESLNESKELYRTLAECCGVGVWHISPTGQTIYINPVMCELLEIDSPDELAGSALDDFFSADSLERIHMERNRRHLNEISHYEIEVIGRRGTRRHLQVTGATLSGAEHRFSGFLGTFTDVTVRKHKELELRQTQKLEAVGRLAAGIAHEINTPIQFVGDSIQFLQDAMQDVRKILVRYRAAMAAGETIDSDQRDQIRRLERDIDLDDLQEQIPKAIERSLEGLNRVATIVRAMKDFAHPDDGRRTNANLNQALQNTLAIARNEYKYVADAVTDFADLPPVSCSLSDLNQVFLNLVVNAAHAIAERVKRQPDFHGIITVATRTDGDHVLITISDTGTGIPAEIRHRIFDPFFTTKPVGRGTGQGLTIAHAVVERHGGTLTFITEVGRGTSFSIRLPIAGHTHVPPGAPQS